MWWAFRMSEVAMGAPLMTIAECDRQLGDITDRYHAAIDEDRLSEAADLWIKLQDLLEIRYSLPQQRTSS